MQIDIRWTTNPVVRSAYAAGLVGSAPDVVLCSTTPVLQALQKLTHSVPLVFVQVSDPVSAGFVSNLARPGSNVTGFTNFEYTIGGKWLELLKEAAPKIDRAGVVVSRDDPSWSRYFAPIEVIAPSLDVQLTKVFLDDAAKIERALSGLADGSSGLIVLPSGGASLYRELIAGLAARLRLPTIYPFRYYILSNGLISYGIDQIEHGEERQVTSIASSREKNQAICRLSCRPSSNLLSISRLRKPLTSKSHRRYSPAPTR